MDDNSHQPDRPTLIESGINISVDPTATDPFFHNCMIFNNVQDINSQKNVSYAWQREGINQRLSIVDCGPLCHTEKLIDTLHTMLAVWVVCTNDFRGIWQTALSIK